MKWYHGTMFSPNGGCNVLHATSLSEMNAKAMKLVKTDHADIESLVIRKVEVKTKKQLIEWLSKHFTHNNG